MQVTDHFELEELVHPQLLDIMGPRLADYVHELALALEDMRDTFGPIIVNNWHTGGGRQNAGLRMPCSQMGARYSAHKFGRAADLQFTQANVRDVHQAILDNPEAFPYITRLEAIEATPTWIHMEIGNRRGPIIVFRP